MYGAAVRVHTDNPFEALGVVRRAYGADSVLVEEGVSTVHVCLKTAYGLHWRVYLPISGGSNRHDVHSRMRLKTTMTGRRCRRTRVELKRAHSSSQKGWCAISTWQFFVLIDMRLHYDGDGPS